MTSSEFLTLAVDISFVMVMLSLVFGFYRIARGPSFGDRVVSLDMLTISIMGFCGLFAILVEDTAFIDVAVVLALIGFLTTLALARFAERRRKTRSEDDT